MMEEPETPEGETPERGDSRGGSRASPARRRRRRPRPRPRGEAAAEEAPAEEAPAEEAPADARPPVPRSRACEELDQAAEQAEEAAPERAERRARGAARAPRRARRARRARTSSPALHLEPDLVLEEQRAGGRVRRVRPVRRRETPDEAPRPARTPRAAHRWRTRRSSSPPTRATTRPASARARSPA